MLSDLLGFEGFYDDGQIVSLYLTLILFLIIYREEMWIIGQQEKKLNLEKNNLS